MQMNEEVKEFLWKCAAVPVALASIGLGMAILMFLVGGAVGLLEHIGFFVS